MVVIQSSKLDLRINNNNNISVMGRGLYQAGWGGKQIAPLTKVRRLLVSRQKACRRRKIEMDYLFLFHLIFLSGKETIVGDWPTPLSLLSSLASTETNIICGVVTAEWPSVQFCHSVRVKLGFLVYFPRPVRLAIDSKLITKNCSNQCD